MLLRYTVVQYSTGIVPGVDPRFVSKGAQLYI